MPCLILGLQGCRAHWLFVALALLSLPEMLLAQTALMPERREKSTYFVGVTPFGAHLSTTMAPTLTAGAYLGRDWMVGAEFGSRRQSASHDPGDDDGVEGSADKRALLTPTHTSLGGYVRWIPLNTLFAMGALHRRTWDGKAAVNTGDPVLLGETALTHMTTEAWVASVGVGNIWQWESGFTLAGTWLVVSSMLTDASDYHVPKQGLTAAELRTVRRRLSGLARDLNRESAQGGIALLTLSWAL